MPFDNAYEAITEENDHSHWAFGTGFTEPLAGVDPRIPDGIDRDGLATYCLMLGDDALVLAQRLSEWITNAPELEEEMAIANIALDLLGQARLLLSRAAQVRGTGDEDALAYRRDASEFTNVHLAELPRGDFADEVVRLLIFATWRLALFTRLVDTADPVLAAVAAKGAREVAYHRDYAAGWTVRLGKGTDESHARLTRALDRAWPYVDELFRPHEVERRAGVDPSTLRADFDAVIDEVLAASAVARPQRVTPAGGGGRDGLHTEALVELLEVMQSVARAHPEGTW